MRTNLKLFRVKHSLTQDEMSRKIGCTRQCYLAIENGKSDGSIRFWRKLQKAFKLKNTDLLNLMKTK